MAAAVRMRASAHGGWSIEDIERRVDTAPGTSAARRRTTFMVRGVSSFLLLLWCQTNLWCWASRPGATAEGG